MSEEWAIINEISKSLELIANDLLRNEGNRNRAMYNLGALREAIETYIEVIEEEKDKKDGQTDQKDREGRQASSGC